MFVLLCSCNKPKDEPLSEESEELCMDDDEEFPSLGFWPLPSPPIRIVIVDEAQNDRLNPESPSYFGDDYVNGIKNLCLYNGKKRTFLEHYYLTGGGSWFFLDDVEKIKTIIRPAYDTFGYFFVSIGWCSPFIEDDRKVTYAYIQYPDGSEDEIKWEYTIYFEHEKIWINGELVFQTHYEDVIVEALSTPDKPYIARATNQTYFNPKYYLWMKPDSDSPLGSMDVKKLNGESLIVLTK